MGEGDALDPFGGGADGAWRKIAAAVGADVLEVGFHAGGAEGAFVGADAGVGGGWGEVGVAEFAVGAEGEGHWDWVSWAMVSMELTSGAAQGNGAFVLTAVTS